MDDNPSLREDIVHLVRLALAGKRRDVEILVRRMMRQAKKSDPSLATALLDLLAAAPAAATPLREAAMSFVPVDQDSRLQLLRQEDPVVIEQEPFLPSNIASALESVVAERSKLDRLTSNDISPTRTLLFTGAPGVGKTLTARWLAARLGLPLLTLDLSTVISSFLGRTGSNLRHVLDYAKSINSVLLLDEFDAIAKRRGDESELGELKRLVTVLLQEIDLWPNDKLLIAATNHGELLDRAVWRRFDMVLDFPMPRAEDAKRAVARYFGQDVQRLGPWQQFLIEICQGRSFSDIARLANQVRRRAIVSDITFDRAIVETLATELEPLSLTRRKQLGARLRELGLSDRQISSTLGLARDTLRKMNKTASEVR